MTSYALPVQRAPHVPMSRLILAVMLVAVVIATVHATSKHGEDAVSVRACLNNKGPMLVFRDHFQADKFYLLCELPDGRWGLQIVRRLKNGWREVTAFVPKDGTLTRVLSYVGRTAGRYTQPLP